jgi:aminoglycoside 6'-N-acetyltransferase I
MGPVTVRLAQKPDHIHLAKMRTSLWPEASFEDHFRELENGPVGSLPSASFVAHFADAGLIGFVDVGLRSHADGCDPARPVAFIEGWFVDPSFRRRGIGAALIRTAENWACSRGCVEMASDTWIDHDESESAHLALGFEIVDRCIHFRKRL